MPPWARATTRTTARSRRRLNSWATAGASSSCASSSGSGRRGSTSWPRDCPGPISRSVLAARLRKLEAVGVVAHVGSGDTSLVRARTRGRGARPDREVALALGRALGARGPAMAKHDPTVIQWWLTHRVDVAAGPERQIVLDLAPSGRTHARPGCPSPGHRADVVPANPMLDPDRAGQQYAAPGRGGGGGGGKKKKNIANCENGAEVGHLYSSRFGRIRFRPRGR